MFRSRSVNSLRNVLFGFLQQFVTLALAFLARTVFIRSLGVEYIGVNGLYSNILTLLSLTELGVGNVLTYSLYSALHDNDQEKIHQLVSYYRKLYRGIALTIMIVGIAIIPFLKYLVKSSLPYNEVVLYYVLYLLNSVVSYFVVFKVTLLRADQKEYIRNIVATVALLFQYSFQIIYILVRKDYIGYLVIQIIFTVLQNLVCNSIVNRQYPNLKNYTSNDDLVDKSNLISDVKSMFVYKVSNVVVTSTDNILISVLLGTIYVGYYSNYSMIINYVSTFINLIITGITGSLGNLNADKNRDHSYTVFRCMVYLFGVITAFCSVCILNLVQGFIPIWIGKEYVLSTSTVLSIVATFYVTHAFDPTWMFCETMGLFRERKYAMVVNAVLNLVLSILLARPLGMTGILGATALARVMTIIWWEPYILFKYKFQRPVIEYVKQQAGIIGTNMIIATVSVLVCSNLPQSVMGLILRGCVCLIVVVLVEVVFMRRTEEFIWLRKKIISIFCRKE